MFCFFWRIYCGKSTICSIFIMKLAVSRVIRNNNHQLFGCFQRFFLTLFLVKIPEVNVLEQTITISTANALQNCKFSSSFSKRRIILEDFYLGWKHVDQNYLPNGLFWSKFDLHIFHQAHFDEACSILDHFIINVAIRGLEVGKIIQYPWAWL